MSIQKEAGDPSRRDFLYVATGMAGTVGLGFAAWPFIDQMRPDASTLAVSTIEIDLPDLERSGVRYVKAQGRVLVDQLTREGRRPKSAITREIAAADVAAVFARYGVDLIAERIESEAVVLAEHLERFRVRRIGHATRVQQLVGDAPDERVLTRHAREIRRLPRGDGRDHAVGAVVLAQRGESAPPGTRLRPRFTSR
mgnify:CR=1 FL=1